MEILPDFVQGWYLLFDASLNTTERNLIHTAVQGDYSLQRIAQELRSQWDDNNIRNRDNRHQTSYLGEDDDEAIEEDLAFPESYQAELLSEEGQVMMAEAEEQAQSALAALYQAKRTLKEARAKQHQVRIGWPQGGQLSSTRTGTTSGGTGGECPVHLLQRGGVVSRPHRARDGDGRCHQEHRAAGTAATAGVIIAGRAHRREAVGAASVDVPVECDRLARKEADRATAFAAGVVVPVGAG